MSFASPWFLLGLLGIAIPVYLHLYHRRTPIRKDFPSLKLIRLSVEFVARRRKMRNLLLLLLRVMVITLITMALARPFVGQSAGARASASTPAAFVVLLDNSMSMGCSFQGISVFNTAKTRALEILEQMGPGDKATVGLVNDPGRLVYSQLTLDQDALKKSIANAPLSMAGTNIASSLLPALKLLAPLASYRRAIYVITDMTASAWQPFVDKYDLAGIEPGIDLVMVPVGGAAPDNLAITDLQVDAPVVMTGRKVPLKVTLANHSSRSRRVRVTIAVNGERKQDDELEIEANAVKEAVIQCAFADNGMNRVTASIQNDAMPFDDERHLAVRVFEPCRILLIKPDSNGSAENREDIFVRFALNPLNKNKDNNFVVETRSSSEARNIDPEGYAAIFLLNQRHLDAALITRLSQYMMRGGNIVTFLGDKVEPDWYNKNLADDLGSGYILPARIFKRVGNAVSRNVGYQLTDLDAGHPAFSIFARDGNGDPGRAQIFEFFQVRPNPAALLLCRMSHGLPGIVEERRGRGRSLLITFAADTSWSNWPVKATWLPFLHQGLIAMITGNELNFAVIRPGMPVSATFDAQEARQITLQTPDGQSKNIVVQQAAQGLVHFTTRDTEQPGYHEISVTNGQKKVIGAFAVNPPADESRLERMNLRQIPRFIPLTSESGRGATVGEKVSRLRDGYDLGMAALLALLILSVAESWFANLPDKKKAE